MKLRVLFVDDEPNVLRALARMIRARRLPWDAAFVDGGPAAMAELEARRFDVMVTDLTMPEVDGVTLLYQVRARWPEVARVLLSGECTVGQSQRAIRVAHQFLAKPCDGPRLVQTVERLGWTRGLGVNPAVRAGAAALTSLPSAPGVYAAIRDAVAGKADLESLTRLAERDIALTAKLLQLVSTPFFTLAPRVDTARGAVGILGVDVLRAALSSPETFRPAEPTACLELDFAALHEGSLSVALRAREKAPREMADRAFLAGWLHDVGRLVLACAPADQAGASCDTATGRASAGACLLGLWGLPDDIVDAVAYQHAPDALPLEHRALAALLHSAVRPPAAERVSLPPPAASRAAGVAAAAEASRRWC